MLLVEIQKYKYVMVLVICNLYMLLESRDIIISPGAKLENGGLPYTESPLSFDGFN